MALAVLGLKSPLTGAFRAEGRLAPKVDAVGVELHGVLGGVTASARGTLKELLRPERFTAEVEAAGPNAALVGAWTGVVGVPARPFDLAGRVRRDGRRLLFDELKVRVGGTSLTVAGTLGELPRCVGTELTITATGSDLSELSALTRLRLPKDAFSVSGRLLRKADGLGIAAVEASVSGMTIHATGTIGEPPALANLDLTADGTGPDASLLSGIARIDLPAEPFEIRGRVARSGPALELEDVAGRLGDDAFGVSGRLVPAPRLVGPTLVSGSREAISRRREHSSDSAAFRPSDSTSRVTCGWMPLRTSSTASKPMSAACPGRPAGVWVRRRPSTARRSRAACAVRSFRPRGVGGAHEAPGRSVRGLGSARHRWRCLSSRRPRR